MRHPFLALALVLPASSAHGQQAVAPAAEPGPIGTRLLDLDGDGALDLLSLHADGALHVRRNVGPRQFLAVPQELPRVEVTDVLCSDLDGDGRPDLYLVSPGADVALLGEGGGSFRAATDELGLLESGIGLSAERLDVDADGLADLLVHNRGSDVLFWARADGRFEREARTSDGLGLAALPGTLLVDPRQEVPGEEPASDGVGSGGSRSLAGSPGAPAGHLGAAVAPSPTSTTLPAFALPINFDAFYVNDDQNEVDSADVIDGSLTGADVSTSGGNVTFGGGATVTAVKGVFGSGSTASGVLSTVSGGQVNTASGDYSTVSGGYGNTASGYYTTVSGGSDNSASNKYSAVSGGRFNTASGNKSTVPGGYSNAAAADFSFAAGRRAKANHQGSFVWGDSVNVDKTSSATDQFNVYAEGGARVFAVGQTTPSMVVDSAGRVGIGTASPAQPLDVLGNMQVDASTLFVDSAFNRVGIGTTTPGRRLHVQNGSSGATPASLSSLVVESSTEASISLISPASQEASLFLGNPTSAANAGAIVFNPFGGVLTNGLVLRTANTNRLAITASGNVGIGTLSPSFLLEVNGSAGKPGGGSWSVSSDRRLKKNIRDLEGALDTLLELRGVTFEYKDPEAVNELSGERIGFIAQEVEEVLPDWVEELGGYKRLTVRGFEALAVEALRELRDENAELRAANEAREARLAALESELANLKQSVASLVGMR